jgi:NAD(P)H-dependent FMN reductase
LPRLGIVIASTRPGRVGLPVARWFEHQAREHGGFDIEVIDLLEVNLPFFDEPKHPRFHDYEHQHTKDWSARIEALDAFAFVMPEYNYGLNAPLKNAIDYLNQEWKYKPAGCVTYGGVAAGTRAFQMFKLVASAVKLTVVNDAVNIPFVKEFMEDDELRANEVMEQAAATMLDELVRMQQALSPLRS